MIISSKSFSLVTTESASLVSSAGNVLRGIILVWQDLSCTGTLVRGLRNLETRGPEAVVPEHSEDAT